MVATLPAAPAPAPAVIRQVEEAVCEIILRDDVLADIPVVDAEDPSCFHAHWSSRVYQLIDESRPGLGLPFVQWYVREEARARREGRPVQVPRRFVTRYPVLVSGPNGQLEIYRG